MVGKNICFHNIIELPYFVYTLTLINVVLYNILINTLRFVLYISTTWQNTIYWNYL